MWHAAIPVTQQYRILASGGIHASPSSSILLKTIHSCFNAPTTHVLSLLLRAPAECSRWPASWEVVVGFLISSSPTVACGPELVLISRPTELNSQIGWPPEVLICSSFSGSTLSWYRSILDWSRHRGVCVVSHLFTIAQKCVSKEHCRRSEDSHTQLGCPVTSKSCDYVTWWGSVDSGSRGQYVLTIDILILRSIEYIYGLT